MQKKTPLNLLGGLSPTEFMKRHWQKKPLLIRQAIPGMKPLIDRTSLLEMLESEEVESRQIVRNGEKWTLKKGPLKRKSLPSLKTPKLDSIGPRRRFAQRRCSCAFAAISLCAGCQA
jgi:50S ribosomal protein L16 3-hydroxylase